MEQYNKLLINCEFVGTFIQIINLHGTIVKIIDELNFKFKFYIVHK
jgi:hypothetical protein